MLPLLFVCNRPPTATTASTRVLAKTQVPPPVTTNNYNYSSSTCTCTSTTRPALAACCSIMLPVRAPIAASAWCMRCRPEVHRRVSYCATIRSAASPFFTGQLSTLITSFRQNPYRVIRPLEANGKYLQQGRTPGVVINDSIRVQHDAT